MAARIDQPTRLKLTTRRPLWLSILAGFSLLLGIVTTIPQFYYVLFALHLSPSDPTATRSARSGTVTSSSVLHKKEHLLTRPEKPTREPSDTTAKKSLETPSSDAQQQRLFE